MDVTSSMSMPATPEAVAQPYLLTVEDAATILNIRRTLAYQLVHRYVETGGAEGIPAIRIGRLWRVIRPALFEQIRRGCIGGSSGFVPDELSPRRRPDAGGAGGPSGTRRLTIRRGGQSARARRPRRESPPQQLPLFPAG